MMALMWNVILIISGFAYLQFSSFAENVDIMSISSDETDPSKGVAVNCGKEPITFTWTPKVLQPSGFVNVTFVYTFPHNLSSGIFNVSLYFHGEDTPFLGYADRFDCDTLKGHTGPYLCPFREKLKTTITLPISNLHILTSYPGTYDVIVQVWNQVGQEMFCLNITAEVQEVYSEMVNDIMH